MFGFFNRRKSVELLLRYDELAFERVVSLGGEVAGLHAIINTVASCLQENKRQEAVATLQAIMSSGLKTAPEGLDDKHAKIYKDGRSRVILAFLHAQELPEPKLS